MAPASRLEFASGLVAVLALALALGCSLHFFGTRRGAAPKPGPPPENTRWTGSISGAGQSFVVNPVYPPVVVGRHDRLRMTLDTATGSTGGPRAGDPEPVIVVNPTFPPQVTAAVRPLGAVKWLDEGFSKQEVPAGLPAMGTRVRRGVEGK
jgi:hypothetical protein